MKVGIIGIGHMGKNIAHRLAGHVELVLYNRTYAKAEALANKIGARAATCLDELDDCELLLMVLPAKETLNCLQLFNERAKPVKLVNLATSVSVKDLQAAAVAPVQILCAKIISHAVEMDKGERPIVMVDELPEDLSAKTIEAMSFVGDTMLGDTDTVGRVNSIAARLALENCIELENRLKQAGIVDERIIKQAMAQVAPGTMKACALGLLGPFALDIVEQIKAERGLGG